MRVMNSGRIAILGISLAVLGSFAASPVLAKRRPPAPVPTASPTPQPVRIVIPPRPTPPLWAPATLTLPAKAADGRFQTVNTAISPVQRTWNFRSAYNVAALNCRGVQYDPIVAGYRAFLKKHVAGLAAANRGVDGLFRQRHGAAFVRPREAYMTQVYNFYSFPPTTGQFCDAALAMSTRSAGVLPAQLSAFAAEELPKLDMILDNFYLSYEQYRVDLAAWDAKYAAIMPKQ